MAHYRRKKWATSATREIFTALRDRLSVWTYVWTDVPMQIARSMRSMQEVHRDEQQMSTHPLASRDDGSPNCHAALQGGQNKALGNPQMKLLGAGEYARNNREFRVCGCFRLQSEQRAASLAAIFKRTPTTSTQSTPAATSERLDCVGSPADSSHRDQHSLDTAGESAWQ
ncbi:hypothetical protein BKA81DRAFT_398781 [Phyllosticta paracitricarpa]